MNLALFQRQIHMIVSQYARKANDNIFHFSRKGRFTHNLVPKKLEDSARAREKSITLAPAFIHKPEKQGLEAFVYL
jgi:hypothetical protein